MIVRGQKINDRYQIIRTIGEGGMANVYLAYDTILDRNVAVKILRGDLAEDEKFVRKFQREAISASSLSHPNIVEMYDVGEDDGRYFIVMEYVEGVTLKNLIKRRGALTLSEVIDIMLQLTSAIACAHDSYIIHRDIKPQNVLILDDGRVKITDFGIAMALNSNELTQTNSVMGSVHYLPPEQANGTGATIKSDIYSLGILMYELITGNLPFKGDSAVEIAIKQMKEPIPSIVEQNPNIPQSVENIILKASAKNPKNRYESARQMYEDLTTCLDESRLKEPKYVYPYPEFEEVKKVTREKKNEKKQEEVEKKENKKGIIALIVSAVVLFVGIIVTCILLLVLPKSTKDPDITVPNVSGMTIVNAEETLKNAGFDVATDVIYEYSNSIPEDMVISTNPTVGRSVKKGTLVTLTVSSGIDGIEIQDYKDKNIEEIKPSLEASGINVIVNYEEHSKDDEVEDGIIISQDKGAGTILKKGHTIIFKVVKIITTYPDFVKEDYSVDGVRKFCEDNGISLNITYKETNEKAEGTILSQSRTAGTKVMSGVTLRIEVAKKVTIVEPPKDDTKTDNKTDTKTDDKTDTKVDDTTKEDTKETESKTDKE